MEQRLIKGFGKYLVTDQGEVMSVGMRVKRGNGFYIQPSVTLQPKRNRGGYHEVCLYKNKKGHSKLVHRLVALTFIPPVEGKTRVNHINGIKTDNRVSNLEWCTDQENHDHAVTTGLKVANGDQAVAQYDLEGNYIATYKSGMDAARTLGLSQGNISQCVSGKKDQYRGFKWCRP